jgi:hypothetical protein
MRRPLVHGVHGFPGPGGELQIEPDVGVVEVVSGHLTNVVTGSAMYCDAVTTSLRSGRSCRRTPDSRTGFRRAAHLVAS